MLMGSVIPVRWQSEAYVLCFDRQIRLNKNVDGLATNDQELSVADKDEKTKQVLGEPIVESEYCFVIKFKREQEAIRPKPTMCMLLPGQYLSCGIGVSERRHARFNLTSADIRRWELCASAINEILKTTSPRNKYYPADTEKVEHLDMFLEERELDETFAIHIPNFRMNELDRNLDEHIGNSASLLGKTGLFFLYLLRFFIPLTAAYGGIHLSAWNFEFPSRVESIIWRTACFIIIGSSFALLAVPSWQKLDMYSMDSYQSFRSRYWVSKEALTRTAGYGFAGLLLLCYGASRLYLVVESFVSLRQVPVGVYAAVPWVENIPHV